MAAKNWAFGFQPYQCLLRANYYAIVTAPVVNYFHGDIVGLEGAAILTPKMGYLPQLYDDGVIDGIDNLIGSVLALFDENMDPAKYILAAAAGNSTIAGYALVADHPNQLFVAREDFATNAITAAEGSNNANIVSETLSLPTVTARKNAGISSQMIDSDSAATTAALNLKLYAPHPEDGDLVADDTPGSSGDEGCRYICQILEHYYNTTGVAGGKSA